MFSLVCISAFDFFFHELEHFVFEHFAVRVRRHHVYEFDILRYLEVGYLALTKIEYILFGDFGVRSKLNPYAYFLVRSRVGIAEAGRVHYLIVSSQECFYFGLSR